MAMSMFYLFFQNRRHCLLNLIWNHYVKLEAVIWLVLMKKAVLVVKVKVQLKTRKKKLCTRRL